MKLNTDQRRLTPAALLAAHLGQTKNFMAAITPGGIEAQEKAGQMEQAEKQTLPINLGQRRGESATDARKPWETLGFKFGATVDDIFVEATFPAGWKKEPSEHDMWTHVMDAKGRKRGAIFYKAAFYDRSAHARLLCRFGVGQDYGNAPTESVFIVDACGKVTRRIEGLERPDYGKDREKATAAANKIEVARQGLWAWLKQEYPECESPLAYWD